VDYPYNQSWSENIQFPGHNHTLEINAISYNNWIREIASDYADSESVSDKALPFSARKLDVFEAQRRRSIIKYAQKSPKLRGKKSLGNGWIFGVKTLPYYKIGVIDWLQPGLVRNRLPIFQSENDCYSKGAVMFTGPAHIPMVVKSGIIWMSLTPNEIFTLREGLDLAAGRVLVAGLGMGWLTHRILEKAEVSSVTQLELEIPIIEFFGTPLQEKFGQKLHLINQDVYSYIKNNSIKNFDTVIFDIWSHYGLASEDEVFQEMKDEHPNAWGWGDVEDCCFDNGYVEYEDAEDEFENDIAVWGKEEPHEWWNLD